MSAHDRRVVHMALADHPEVTTESEGEGPARRVVIFPKKRASQAPSAPG
jgi:spoIIIJ-associated protein